MKKDNIEKNIPIFHLLQKSEHQPFQGDAIEFFILSQAAIEWNENVDISI